MKPQVPETIVVTGASSGIGRELAIQLAAPGREIWLVGRDEKRLAETRDAIASKGGEAKIVTLDLSDLEVSARYLDETFPSERRVDQVYLSAAVTLFGEAQDILPEDWDRLYKTNLLSVVQWTHHFYRGMVERRGGRIVLISSLVGYAGYPSATVYATMKGGLVGLFKSLWHEARDHGVSIHLASPGYVRTRIYEVATFRGTSYEKTMEVIKGMGFGLEEPDEMAEMIISKVAKGKSEFAIPGYAALVKWIAPRMPWVLSPMHARMMKLFRSAS